MIEKKSLVPRICGARHPKYPNVTCRQEIFDDNDCLDVHRGMVGNPPNRKWIYFSTKTKNGELPDDYISGNLH